MESISIDAQPSVISEPLPSTSTAIIETSTQSVAAQTNRESENFDRYADDWDTSSSDEFDSEFDTDKEGKWNVSSSSIQKGASESRWKKDSVDLQTESGHKSSDRPEADDSAVHEDSAKLNVKTAESGSDKNEESPVDKRDEPEEKSEVKLLSNENKDTSNDNKPSGDMKHEGNIHEGEHWAKVNTYSADNVQNSVETELCAKVNRESANKRKNSVKTTPVTEEHGDKSQLEEAPKEEYAPTNVQRRPIPIIIVKPPTSPEEIQFGEEYMLKPESTAR